MKLLHTLTIEREIKNKKVIRFNENLIKLSREFQKLYKHFSS